MTTPSEPRRVPLVKWALLYLTILGIIGTLIVVFGRLYLTSLEPIHGARNSNAPTSSYNADSSTTGRVNATIRQRLATDRMTVTHMNEPTRSTYNGQAAWRVYVAYRWQTVNGPQASATIAYVSQDGSTFLGEDEP